MDLHKSTPKNNIFGLQMPKLKLKSIKTAVRICYTKKIDEKIFFSIKRFLYFCPYFFEFLAKDNFFFEKVGL